METQYPVLCSSKPLKPELEKFQKIPITSEVFKIGRGLQNTVVMPYKCLSKDHCVFKKVEDDWVLENCSYSSIKINGDKLRKGQKRKLHDQDIIKLESSNELVYMFNKNSIRKRRKLDGNNENVKKKMEEPSTTSNQSGDQKEVKSSREKQKEQIMSEVNRKEREIYNEYATRIEKLKGSKRTVKRQKALLKVRRDAQLASIRVEVAEKFTNLIEQTQKENKSHENPPKESSKQDLHPEASHATKRESVYKLRARIREQDRARMREKKELRKLRKETEQLRFDREKKLKELEKQKLIREKELQEELSKLNKKLAKQIELHESEKRRAEQLMSQQREQKVEPSSGESKLDMESELQCSICSELFVRATTLGCSHSFCQYCIRRWRANKRDCPICRAPIKSECRSIVLESLVEKMAGTSEEAKKKRQELVKAREELEARDAAATAESSRARGNLFPDYGFSPELRDYYDDENSESNSSYYGRESSLEPDPDMLVMEDDDEEIEVNSSDEFSMSDQVNGEDIENSAFENSDDEHDSAPENDRNENSEPENYDEGEHSEPEHYDEGENSEPGNYEGEQSEPENYDEGEQSEPENYDEGEHSEPENYEGEQSEPENYDEGEHSEPENYDEGENSAPEYMDHDMNSAPEDNDHDGDNYEGENDGESAPDHDFDAYGENWRENDSDGEMSPPEYDDGSNSYTEQYDYY